MSEPNNLLRSIFNRAVELPDAGQRADYLAVACRDNPVLRQQVEALIAAHQEAGKFLGSSGDTVECDDLTARERKADGEEPQRKIGPDNYFVADVGRAQPAGQPGDHIGRYKLLQQIGEGGCGVVFMAEQEQPIRRRVALKVIKLGMDTRSVIARFEAERQALAMMDHPNIAKVLDAGATDAGRPYFVMELVKGVRITDYCDQNNLPTAARLDLFMQVCHAIQHAHQKGIIHRDIKPSNILVTLHDGVPVPKVIDFGIAKATSDQRLTDKTLFTAFEQFMGTPAYMSPEQAEMSGLDIDTRSDIYALGVLLYELLTGRPPFDGKELLASGLDEMRRTIREREPAKPSTRLSTMLAADLITVAKHRQSESAKLASSMRGDLDWIVMKALEKDRTRRYDTANGLAIDIARHLNNEPVAARPPSNLYRFEKLVRRNKLAVAALSAVLTALLAGLCASSRLYFQENKARQRAVSAEKEAQTEAAKSEQVAQFLKAMLNGVGPSVARGRDTTMVREILEKTADRVGRDLTNQPLVEAELRETVSEVYLGLGELQKAEAMQRKALTLRKSVFGDEHSEVAASLNKLAIVLLCRGSLDEAEGIERESLEMRKKLLGNQTIPVAGSLNNLAVILGNKGNLQEADSMIRQALAIKITLLGKHHSYVTDSLEDLCSILLREGKTEQAEHLFNDFITSADDNRSQNSRLLRARGDLFARVGRWSSAVKDFSRVTTIDPSQHEAYHSLAAVLVRIGDLESYGQNCRHILVQFRETQDSNVAEQMARDCLLLAGSHTDPVVINEWAQTAIRAGRNSVDLPRFQFTKALAEYRQGSPAVAVEEIGQFLASTQKRMSLRAGACAVLALACHKLQRQDDAIAALGRGAQIVASESPKNDTGDLGADWVDWIMAGTLMNEAKRLIEGE